MSSALLAFGILTKGNHWQLILFLSPSFVISALVAQWSPLLLAGAFIPALQMFMICKPNIGFASFLYKPSRSGLILTIIFGLLSLAIMISWPIYWMSNSSRSALSHISPIFQGYAGLLLLFSIFAWREREGRLLLYMSFIPQSPFYYDQLILYLIPRSPRQMIIYIIITWIGFMLWFVPGIGIQRDDVISSRPFSLLWFYIPAMIILLWPKILLIFKIAKGKLKIIQ